MPHMEPTLATAFIVAFFVMNFVQERRFAQRGVDTRGDLPIGRGWFVLGKASMVLAWISIIVEAWVADLRVVSLGAWLPWVAVSLEALGMSVIALGYAYLGDANQIGLTPHTIRIRREGPYRVSRNPIYVGFHLLTAAALLYTANPVVLVLAATSVAIHHAVVLSEERHLERVFGDEYREYRARVRRYL